MNKWQKCTSFNEQPKPHLLQLEAFSGAVVNVW